MEHHPLPPPDPAPSLAERLGAAIGDARSGPTGGGRRLGWMLAILLPMGPLLTMGAAEWLSVRSRTAALGNADGAAAKRAAAIGGERRELTRLGEGSFAATLDRVARALPADDRLVSLSMVAGEDGRRRLAAQVATADPDRLRAALSRVPAMARLRSTGERPGDGVVIVALEEAS